MKQIIVNEDYLDLVPRPSKEEYSSLYQSISMEGMKDPIVVNKKGVVLDGHTRYEICMNLGIKPETRIKQFKTLADEKYYVIESNLNRRQLTPFGKVELSYALYLDIRKQLKERVKKYSRTGAPDMQNLNWRKELSKRIGVGENWCQQGVYIINSKNERIMTRLRNGTMSISNGYDAVRKEEKHPARKITKTLPTVTQLMVYYKDDISVINYLGELVKGYSKPKKQGRGYKK